MVHCRLKHSSSHSGTLSGTVVIACRSVLVVLLLIAVAAFPARADDSDTPPGESQKPVLSSPLTFFQRVISKADGDRCPMYPSCSHYAATVFDRHNAVTAWILTCDRLLRCGHDETRTAPQVYAAGRTRAYDPVAANTFWWRKPDGAP